MHFDWYQATIPEVPNHLVEILKRELAPLGTVETGRGRHNYNQSILIRSQGGERVACVLAGGSNGHPNVTSSGNVTSDFVEIVRAYWPNHNVTRFDAAQDFVSDDSWQKLEDCCRLVTAEHQVKGRAIVPDDASEGRTYYMGAPSSDVRARLYEKTQELRKDLPPTRWHEVPEGMTRLELQVRPKHPDARAYASTCTPEQVWGFSRWSRELAEKAFLLNVERINSCLLYTSPSPRDGLLSRMPSSA